MTNDESNSNDEVRMTKPGPARCRPDCGRSFSFAVRIAGRIARVFAVCTFLAILVFVSFFAAVRWWPYRSSVDRTEASSLVEDRNGVPLAAFTAVDGQWRLPLAEDEISPHLLRAIIAVEDNRFYEHHGVDWKSVTAAAWQDIRHPGMRRGASTITMQVERLCDPQPRTLLYKISQAIAAEQLEQRETKRQILVEYVNHAPFGGNLVGAGAASWRYFGRPCAQLSLGQAALLAGLPQSPNRFRPDRFPSRGITRRNHVLDRMVACGFITREQREEAAAEPIDATWRPLPQDRPEDDLPKADGALPSLLKLVHDRPGQLVRSTIDAAVQRQAALATREQLRPLVVSGISAAAVVVLDTQTSQCLASVSLGGVDGSIDLTRRSRSTGSTLKPFIYAAAFDAGMYGPRSILSDSPSAWPGYQPNDYDRTFRGNLTAADALAESRNIPAMLVLAKVGIEPAVGVMDAAGLHGLARSPERYGLSLAIGGAEASPMEIAEAYAALGRGGISKPIQTSFNGERLPEVSGGSSYSRRACLPFPYGEQTRRLYENWTLPSSNQRCLRSDACWEVLNALSDSSRTAAICPEASQSHVAWKTGTSSGHRDAWCAAVTRRRTIVVWVGNAGGEGSPSLVGHDAAAPLALQLIAMLDAKDEAWPIVPVAPIASSQHPTSAPGNLVLVRPIDGQQVVLTSDSPRSRQQLLLEALHRGNRSKMWWFVDGQLIGSCDDSQRLWWNPVGGSHDLRVVDAEGQSASARVQVRLAGD
jgi:penicillin-binding protein 1C